MMRETNMSNKKNTKKYDVGDNGTRAKIERKAAGRSQAVIRSREEVK